MKLSHLPDDVLFHISLFLEPNAIIHLRKTNKRLHNFTWESTVWRNVHRSSSSFLPPFQSTEAFHRLVARAEPLEKAWEHRARLRKVAHRIPYNTALGQRPLVRLLQHGRFLLLGQEKSMSLYDLERNDGDQPVFAITDLEAKFSYAQNQINTTLLTDDIYIPTFISKESSRSLVIWQLQPSGSGSDVRRVADISLPFSREQFTNLLVSNGVIIFDTDVDKSVVYRVATRTFYRFPQRGNSESPWNVYQNHTIEHIADLNTILIVHTNDQPVGLPLVEVFTFPANLSDELLVQTHAWECPRYFTEPRFIAFSHEQSPTDSPSLRVSLAAIFHGMGHDGPTVPSAVRPFQLTFHADGTTTPDFLRFLTPPPGTSAALNGLVVTSDGVNRARAIAVSPSISGDPNSHGNAVLYDIDLRTEQAIKIVGLVPTGQCGQTSFDGFRGRFCIESAGSIKVMDAF
ncbi:hypothetical protein PM082_020456 [Marasmius tenuissimus]|nr:hypothetical protein PM082_020456 [Marasmius tenuissimus]